MLNESGNVISGRPFPGHEVLFMQILGISKRHLGEILNLAISTTDKFLYDICQQDQSTIGSPNIENFKLFRSATHTIEHNFSKAVDSRFALFQMTLKSAEAGTLDLSLVDIDDMEDVVNAELVSEALSRSFSDAISITGQRFCVLFGLQLSEQSKTPLTEKHISEFLRASLSGALVPAKVRTILYRNYEQSLLSLTSLFLSEVNETLAKAGLLPHLHTIRPAFKPGSAKQPVANQSKDSLASLDDQTGTRVMNEMPLPPAGAAENALFEEICNFLHSWRPQPERNAINSEIAQSSSNNKPLQGTSHSLSKNEMVSLLSILQSAMPSSISSAMKNNDASISSMLKFEMFNNAGNIGLPSNKFDIKREDEDAVDLVGMLFDVLMSERDFRDEAKTMMSRLVVPYAKAAILDRRLFLTKAHPARKLLNALTEAIEGNQGDGPQERELLNKAESTVDRLVVGFNEDIAIFELLEQEMRSFLDQHRRRIDLAEKRAKEAQRGQDRLENARMLAAIELESRTNNADLPAVIQDFFSRYWTHHLSMIALREGENSPSWVNAIKLADDVIEVLKSEPAVARAQSMLNLTLAFETVLSSSGVLADTSLALINKIADSASHYHIDAPPKVVVTKVADTVSGLSESSLHMVFNKNALDYDPVDADYFKTLTIGAWLQLEASGGGYSPVKLAWISPISSRLMFVNRRGVRVLVVSVEELAQMKKQGKLIVHEQDNVFEQTMDRVLNRLKTDFA